MHMKGEKIMYHTVNGASIFFICIYLHTGQNIYHGSHKFTNGRNYTPSLLRINTFRSTARLSPTNAEFKNQSNVIVSLVTSQEKHKGGRKDIHSLSCYNKQKRKKTC